MLEGYVYFIYFSSGIILSYKFAHIMITFKKNKIYKSIKGVNKWI